MKLSNILMWQTYNTCMRVKFFTLDINDADVKLFSRHLNVMNILSVFKGKK